MIRNQAIKLLALCGLAISGCSTTVRPLDIEFPTPLIEQLPLSLGLYYDDDLRNFTYNETVSDGTSWQIELGEGNTRLFDRLFRSMFSSIVEIDDIDNSPGGIDAILQPVLEEYAFLTPRELGSRFYAVSIRYRVFLFDTDGNELAAWPINAYGQSRANATRTGGLKVSPLQAATNLAMRDAAAGAIMMLRTQPEILALMEQENADAETVDQQETDEQTSQND